MLQKQFRRKSSSHLKLPEISMRKQIFSRDHKQNGGKPYKVVDKRTNISLSYNNSIRWKFFSQPQQQQQQGADKFKQIKRSPLKSSILNGINSSTSAIRHLPLPPSAGSYWPRTNSPMLDGNDAKIMASQYQQSNDVAAKFLEKLRQQKELEKCNEWGYNRNLLKGLDKRKINFFDSQYQQQQFFDVKIEPTYDARKKQLEVLDNFASLQQPNEMPFSIHGSHHKVNNSEDYFISAKFQKKKKSYKNKILSQKLDQIKKNLCNKSKFLVSPPPEIEVIQSFLNQDGIQTERCSPNKRQSENQSQLPPASSIKINDIPIQNPRHSQIVSDAYFSDLDKIRQIYRSETKKTHPIIKKSSITQKFLRPKDKSIKLLNEVSMINNSENTCTPPETAFTPIKRTSQPSDQSNSSKPLDFKYKRRLHPRPASNKIMQLFSPHQFEKKVRSERDIQKQIHGRLNSQNYYTNASTKLNTSDQRSEASLCFEPMMNNNNNNFSYQSQNQCARQLIFQAPIPQQMIKKSQQRIALSHKKQNLSMDQRVQKRLNQIQSASKADVLSYKTNNQVKHFQSESKRNKAVKGGVNPSYLLTFGGDNSSHCSGDQLPAEFLFQSQEDARQHNSIDKDDESNEEIKLQQHLTIQQASNEVILPYKTSNFGGKIKQDEISDYSTNVPAHSINGENINSPFRFNQAQQEKRQLVKYEDGSQSFISSQLINSNSRKMIQKSVITGNRHSCPEVKNQSMNKNGDQQRKEDQQIMQLALQSLTLE